MSSETDAEKAQDAKPQRPCDVCFGTPGWYPIIDRYGSQLYEITCPECFGLGTVFYNGD